MMLTAAAVAARSSVILFDPFFPGLAIAVMAGEIASLLLSRMAVPVLFYLSAPICICSRLSPECICSSAR
ncbi:MAG TPA: hypothetical protein VK789_08240 [Bryobacteraceae bacterium]|jgi:hypothetical protein|nr:hypothetical protein [Bryobacteraceae bacterium]